MPNHYHLIIKQAIDGGITQFMQKLGTGYAMYFNKRWDRKGILFEGKFKAKIIESDEYLMHLSRYIHLNPLNIMEPHWKQKKIKDIIKAGKFLEEYRWSSYPIYTKKSASGIISLENIEKILLNTGEYEKFTLSYTPEDLTPLESYNPARPTTRLGLVIA
jgi:putative transposase